MSADPSSTGLAVPLVEALNAARSPSFMPARLAKHLPHHTYILALYTHQHGRPGDTTCL